MKKTFVDHYLLGSRECEQWTSVEEYTQLNSYEKVLLVRYLMEFGKEAEARQISKVIENEAVNNRFSF
jgi:16S rRNA C1402 N4-methylase RsmH